MSYESLDDALFRELHEWSAELADESTEPTNVLSQAEEATMSHTIESTKTFSLDKWLGTLDVITGVEVPSTPVVVQPSWMECKYPMKAEHSFAITAAVVKAARRITDGLRVASARLQEATEALHVQELRGLAELGGRIEGAGFNPDGTEYEDAVLELHERVDELEAIIDNGKAMLAEVFKWIEDYADLLELKVEVGHTVTKDMIGNEFRSPKLSALSRDTLLIGIAKQKEFIARNRK
jgi:hypothetical protein